MTGKTTYSAWCLYCLFWQECATLEEQRQVRDEHVRTHHPDKEEPMPVTAEAPAAVEGAVDPPLETPEPEPELGQLALPGIDGVPNDWIELAISGRIPLDRNNPDHCALVRSLVAGKTVNLDVSGYVVGRGQTLKRDEDEGDEVTFTTKVKVTELRPPFS